MKISFLYEQKIILIKQKSQINTLKINEIFFASLEKYKKYLTFIIEEEGKNNNKEDIKNNNSKI